MLNMLLKELIRFSSQHRNFYCYLILSIWIFLLIAGMYKYINLSESSANSMSAKNYFNTMRKDENIRMKKYQQDCNSPKSIILQNEGGILDGWKLQGVIFLTRHGDRGPISHVRGINSVDCGVNDDSLVNKYKAFLLNATSHDKSWIKPGPFHGFPLFTDSKVCFLGQMTQIGISQLLHIGVILKKAYGHSLGLLNRRNIPLIRPTTNNSNHPEQLYNSDEIVIYSTKYRRTFQSSMALMFEFIPNDRWTQLTVQESHSLSFCFSDCVCPQADLLKKILSKEAKLLLSQHPAIGAVVQWVGTSLLQNPNGQMNPLEVRDAVLSILCHDAPLPCHKLLNMDQNLVTTVATTTDNSDLINIDQDDISIVGGGNSGGATVETDDLAAEPEPEGCLEQSHVAALMSYTHWQVLKENRSKYSRRAGILRAYGLIRNIVSYMLRMISGEKTKFVLYSGHDRTLQYILAALGLNLDSPFIVYASRLSFEVYKSDHQDQFYFRLLYNGRDVTRQIDFCEGSKSLRVNRGSRGNKADLCPIENIIRFIHDDYFSPLNATNFKDACSIQKDNEF